LAGTPLYDEKLFSQDKNPDIRKVKNESHVVSYNKMGWIDKIRHLPAAI
jgi:hypothetical protein